METNTLSTKQKATPIQISSCITSQGLSYRWLDEQVPVMRLLKEKIINFTFFPLQIWRWSNDGAFCVSWHLPRLARESSTDMSILLNTLFTISGRWIAQSWEVSSTTAPSRLHPWMSAIFSGPSTVRTAVSSESGDRTAVQGHRVSDSDTSAICILEEKKRENEFTLTRNTEA